MNEHHVEVYLDEVKLEPTARGIIPVSGHNLAPFDEYHFTILGHKVCICVGGSSRIRLRTEDFEKYWIDDGWLRWREPGVAYEPEELLSNPGEMVAYLRAHNVILVNCVFHITADVENTWLENCLIVCSTVCDAEDNTRPWIENVSFYKSDICDCKINAEGSFQSSILQTVDITCDDFGRFEISNSVCGTSDLYGRSISLVNMSVFDSDLFSEAAMSLAGFNIECLAVAVPVMRLRSKFDYFKIELNKCTLVIVRDGTQDSSFFVCIEGSPSKGRHANSAEGFVPWLTANLISHGEGNPELLIDYVKKCIESRLNLLKTLGI